MTISSFQRMANRVMILGVASLALTLSPAQADETYEGKTFPNQTESEQPPVEGSETGQRGEKEFNAPEADVTPDVNTLPASAAGVPPSQTGKSPIDVATLEELQNLPVLNQKGEQLGDLSHFVFSKSGNEAGAVITIDGLWGTEMGAKQVLAPVEALRLEKDKIVWQTSKSEHELKQGSNSFNKDGYTPIATTEYATLGEVKAKTR